MKLSYRKNWLLTQGRNAGGMENGFRSSDATPDIFGGNSPDSQVQSHQGLHHGCPYVSVM
ncbi:protein of unknown function [Aminobacter niigataensis]|nr:protein of unknown function [Aminobacter niigataensis]